MVGYVDNPRTAEAINDLYCQVTFLHPEQFRDVPFERFYNDAINGLPLSPNGGFRVKRIEDGKSKGKLTLEKKVMDGWVVDSDIQPVGHDYPII